MNLHRPGRTIFLLILLPVTVIAQTPRDVAPLTHWPAPLYWQPPHAENQVAAEPGRFGNEVAEDTRPANSLVFVGMTPCRVVDTRTGSGFIGAFGAPSLIGGASRAFPIQSSTTCSIPSIAQAYSFNITVVPPGFLDFITVWPTGQARPNASTLNGYVGTVIANAAIVPAGTGGSVDVYASQFTDLIIDINGYYASQSGITLTQGSAPAPSLSFAGDAGTGIFSAGTGSVDISTGGTTRLTVRPDGNVGIGTSNPTATLAVNGTAAVSGGLSIGGGSVVTTSDNLVQSGAAPLTLTLPLGTTITASNCITQAVSAPGSAPSMAVVISPAGDPNTRGLSKLIWQAYVNTSGQVTAEFCKFGSGNALSTADQSFNVRILR